MQSAVAQKPIKEKNNHTDSVPAKEVKHDTVNELGSEAGMPVFLQRVLLSNTTPSVDIQRMCDDCEKELTEDSPQVQSKLTVGVPDDEYEQEADQVADAVMRMPASPFAARGSSGEDELPETSTVQRKTVPSLYLQRICAECKNEQNQTLTVPEMQTKPESGMASGAGGYVAHTVKSVSGGGAVPDHVRNRVEPVLGSDMGHVRVHDDTRANQAASSLNAKAFTHQNHIYLGSAESAHDLNLMAHEATHVAQQEHNKQTPVFQRRARDFQVRGRHPDTASFSKIAFYNYASSWLHPDERTKVDAMVMPADRDLELRGFASEEGDTVDNTALVDRRMSSVKSRLLSEGHEAANISENPRLGDAENQIDYRRWRAVEMIESGAPAMTPECAAQPEFETPCPAAKSTRIQSGINRSMDMIDESINRLGDTATYPNAQVLLQRLFTGAALADVTVGLLTIKSHLSTYAANTPQCATACHSDCEDTLAYNNPEVTPAAMVVCPGFHTAGDADYAAVTLLHEASHAAPGMGSADHAYEWDRLLDQLNDVESLDNADSYTMLVYLIHHPGARSIGPATDDTTNITDAGELSQVETAVARVEQWLTNSTSETQSLYSEIREARTVGVWNNSWYEDVMTHASNHFPLTSPPGAPDMEDQERVAAIYDRFNTMSNAMGQVLDIRKRNGSVAHWQVGPGAIVRVGPTFFGRPLVEQIELLLAALIRATPDISTAYHSRYVEYTKDLRSKSSLGP